MTNLILIILGCIIYAGLVGFLWALWLDSK